jgi:hypothetical protein
MITTPSRLSGLRLQQQSFRKIMDPFQWTYVIENCMDIKEGDSNDDSSIDKDESVEEDEDNDDKNATSSPTKS